MTDIEISRALALAIGWELDQMQEHKNCIYVADWPRKDNRATALNSACYPVTRSPWDKFDYRDPAVIWPIAERYNCFPRSDGTEWCALWLRKVPLFSTPFYADTAAKAVALAVIGGHAPK